MSVSLIDGHIDPDTNRMTDEQLIKAWEDAKKYEFAPNEFFIDETLDLINHQKAEIERLNKQIVFEIESAYDRGAKVAIKEFAERLKVLCRHARFSVTVTQELTGTWRLLDNIAVVDEYDIDNLVKEMVGED